MPIMTTGSTCPDLTGNATASEKIDSLKPTPTECRGAVVQSDHVRGIHEVAVQESGGRTQGIACIHVLLVFRIRQPPMIAQSRNQGVGGLGMSGRKLVLQALEAHPDLERQG